MASAGMRGLATREWPIVYPEDAPTPSTKSELLRLWDQTTDEIEAHWPGIPPLDFRKWTWRRPVGRRCLRAVPLLDRQRDPSSRAGIRLPAHAGVRRRPSTTGADSQHPASANTSAPAVAPGLGGRAVQKLQKTLYRDWPLGRHRIVHLGVKPPQHAARPIRQQPVNWPLSLTLRIELRLAGDDPRIALRERLPEQPARGCRREAGQDRRREPDALEDMLPAARHRPARHRFARARAAGRR